MRKEGSLITFYSYKGGVGRTFALANIAALLAKWNFRVLCIDWDLEAPGLHLYFEPWIREPEHGLVEMMSDLVSKGNFKWQDYLTRVEKLSGTGELSLICAGYLDQDYFKRMQALDWDMLYAEHNLGLVLEALREEWKANYDFVLIDSRTGITDIGGICTVQLPDFLVLFATANQQSLDGIKRITHLIKKQHSVLPVDRAELLMLPIVAHLETRFEYERGHEWLDKFAEELAPLYTPWLHNTILRDGNLRELLNYTRIPYIPYWSFGERLPVIEKGTEDYEDIGFAFETLAAMLAQNLAGHERLLHDRDAYVAQVDSRWVREAMPFVTGRPLIHPRQFFGRERELRRIFAMMSHGPLQNVAIFGPRRSGKTSLLLHLKNMASYSSDQLRPEQRTSRQLSRLQHYKWIFVDFQDPRLGNQEKLLSYILSSMELPIPDYCNLESFVNTIIDHRIQTPTVILLDELDVASRLYPELDHFFWDALRFLQTSGTKGEIAFMIAASKNLFQYFQPTSIGSPFFNIFGYTLTLGPFKESEARDLISSSPIPFAAADVAWILAKSRCWPFILQILCQERLAALREEESSNSWRARGLEQIRLMPLPQVALLED